MTMSEDSEDKLPEKSFERRVLAFMLIFLAPILTVFFVGGYGFIVWMLQLVLGPPGA